MIAPFSKDFATADLSDAHPDARVVDPGMVAFGTREKFCGPIRTVSAPEDNTLVRAALETQGEGHVLVVDGVGSMRCALVGDQLARLARDHGWAGVVVNGCIRDAATIDTLDIAVLALGTHPRRSAKRSQGTAGQAVTFMGVRFAPGDWLYADADGVVVAADDIR